METIRFRAKTIAHNHWVYGDLNQHPIHYDCQIIEDGVIHYSVDRDTVGQFTSFLDAKGVEIYHGDILKSFANGITHFEVRIENGETALYNNIGYWGTIKKFFELARDYNFDVLVESNIYGKKEYHE